MFSEEIILAALKQLTEGRKNVIIKDVVSENLTDQEFELLGEYCEEQGYIEDKMGFLGSANMFAQITSEGMEYIRETEGQTP